MSYGVLMLEKARRANRDQLIKIQGHTGKKIPEAW
jgi:hypothetical protein